MTSLLEECIAAARGLLLLVAGRREAASRFDFSPRGLVGSYLALLVVMAVITFLPALLPGTDPSSSRAQDLFITILPYACEIGFAALALRQLKRSDGFVPFLVTENWSNAIGSAVIMVFTLLGLGMIAFPIIGIMGLIVKINSARLIVTLSPLQVAIFVVAQFVGGVIGLILIVLMFPDLASQLTSTAPTPQG